MKNLTNRIAKFRELANAKSYSNHCVKLHLIVLGDDGLFWVAKPAITEMLVKSGYEYAL